MPNRPGRKSLAQTPAPKSERIYGSSKNVKESATEKKAKDIILSEKTLGVLKDKLEEFKKENPNKKSITLSDLKAVYRRGSGAYSSSHRPTITGGAPNSRAAWSYARVNKFLKKASGEKVKAAYVQDDDLMAKGGLILDKAYSGKDVKKYLEKANYQDDSFLQYIKNSDKYVLKNVNINPNGNPSNLTPEQYKLVRTPQFKAWFGDFENDPENASKVVDENGEPLIVYHGSRSEFNIFDLSKSGESSTVSRVGFWFTPIKDFAYNFASDIWWGTLKEPKVLSLFLNIKNPKIFESGGDSAFSDSYEKFRTDLYKVEGKKEFDANVGGIGMALKNPSQTIEKYRELLKYENYDGVIIKNTRFDRRSAGGYNDQYIALYPEQIKLADGTNTTFDANNPDIRFEKGGFTEDSIYDGMIDLGFKNDLVSGSLVRGNVSIKLIDKLKLNADSGNYEKGNQHDVVLDDISVNKNKRQQGEGSRAMIDLITLSDKKNKTIYLEPKVNRVDSKMSKQELVKFYKKFGFELVNDDLMIRKPKIGYKKGGKVKLGDCYVVAGKFAMFGNPIKIDFIGEPYIVHAEVKGQGKIEGIRYGHAWVEDDVNVYDYSNGREIVLPKQIYYMLGDVNVNDKTKYQRYTFAEARSKMLETGNYGSWDIVTDFAEGGDVSDSQDITCISCGWQWNTMDSDPSDKYVCHKCGFDNTLFYDNELLTLSLDEMAEKNDVDVVILKSELTCGKDNNNIYYKEGGQLLKKPMTLEEISEKNSVDIDILKKQLNKGIKHELEHTDYPKVAETIALHHIGETPDYYDRLPKDLDEGGDIEPIEEPEQEIIEFLKNEKQEALDVLTCGDTRIFKMMICKAKVENAKKRENQTENAEEKNVWQEVENIWKSCMNDILNNKMPEFKKGGSTEDCGCGKLYSKGGLSYSKGGLAYGNSHDKGGMPMQVKSTGQNIEIEGGEAVVNKRSMQMKEKLEFEGERMTPCEVISKINEMGGGVKLKCQDVKEIIAEDGNF